MLVVALVGTLVLALVPSPYVIERPGPVFDTLGNVSIGGNSTPMIEIPGQKTWETAGALDLLTVNLAGDPGNLPNWLEVASAWFDPSQAVLPVASVYPAGYSVEDSNKQGAVDMQNSQKDAIAAALRALGHEVPAAVTVADTMKGSPARGVLENGDTIVRVAGTAVDSIPGLRRVIASHRVGSALSIDVVRGGQARTVTVTSISSGGPNPVPIIGIGVAVDYDFPFDVKIQLENVGGPSAGQMFALGIVDKLTPGSLTGGRHVAGTGTIDDSGTIGKIGGIRQKMYGAERAGATIFLAPRGDCGEVVGHVPDGLRVIAVKTLKDSLAALKVIASGGDAGTLPGCTTGLRASAGTVSSR
jgi:PDZ domain-containing protein